MVKSYKNILIGVVILVVAVLIIYSFLTYNNYNYFSSSTTILPNQASLEGCTVAQNGTFLCTNFVGPYYYNLTCPVAGCIVHKTAKNLNGTGYSLQCKNNDTERSFVSPSNCYYMESYNSIRVVCPLGVSRGNWTAACTSLNRPLPPP
jgi:hypothetical protein